MAQATEHYQGKYRIVTRTHLRRLNNLLTLQENHVEEFFQYHGVDFLSAMEKLIEDIIQREVSTILSKIELSLDSSSGRISVSVDCLKEYQAITQENIDLDIQALINTAVNSEVIVQRKMAKQQYLESQGFSQGSDAAGNIQGQPQMGQMNQQMMQQQQAFGNQSGYPVPPAGYDNMNNPYWVDPATGQMTYTAPTSGLGLGKVIQKGAAWAKWLA